MRAVQTIVLVSILAMAAPIVAQRNNPFSANPDPRNAVAVANFEPIVITVGQPSTWLKKSAEPTKSLVKGTDTYRVGAGDVLNIVLANAPNASGDYSISSDGSIDFPLAGARSNVEGMTTDEISGMLSSRIAIYKNAQVQVKVREFGSHKINVRGMVERNGERSLLREAMPLFTIKAMVGVDRTSSHVRIRRKGSQTVQTFDLRDNKTDDVLVSAGDDVEFVS